MSLLELPLVTVGDSLLTVRTVAPAQVTAGIAFTYSLQVWKMCGGSAGGGGRIPPRSSPFVCELDSHTLFNGELFGFPLEIPLRIYRSTTPLLPALALPLQIQNFSHHVVELAVSLQESHGFVLSGERTQVSKHILYRYIYMPVLYRSTLASSPANIGGEDAGR